MFLLSYIYFVSILVLGIYGLHRLLLVFEVFRRKPQRTAAKLPEGNDWPKVCVQIPLYNENAVAKRIIESVAQFNYPRERFEIQVVDDSEDETIKIVDDLVSSLAGQGVKISVVRRATRCHYKAGALQNALHYTDAEFIAVFDADFIPPQDFLLRTIPSFAECRIAYVQTRWGHINRNQNILTRAQAVLLDAHFLIEHLARSLNGSCFNFNGTAGLWRRSALEDAGGWEGDTLTEDLDLSYRTYLKGWRGVYLVDIVCPAELPDTFHAYKSQQYRWSKGTAQVLKKLIGPIMTSSLSLRAKVEAFFHLSAHLCYLLLVYVTFFTVPVSLWRSYVGFSIGLWVEAMLFLVALGTLFVFFAFSQIRQKRTSLLDIFFAFLVGIGISLHCSVAAIQGLFAHAGAFVRTPKSGIEELPVSSGLQGVLSENIKNFRAHPKELFFFSYLMLGVVALCLFSSLLAVPFAVLLLLGYSTVLLGGAVNE